jgi:hypothetical protein
MNSSLISKIEKAKRYAAEPDRVKFRTFEVDFRGDNDAHRVKLEGDIWQCTCDFFSVHRICAHVMALERLFGEHLSEEARYARESVVPTPLVSA